MAPRRETGAKRGAKGNQRLGRYESKRDFAATPEPAGAAAGPAAGAPRFVIHQHSARRLHWDLRLEHDGALVSWAVPKGIPEEPGENRFAAATEDHPIEYLDFHGEIPKGNYGAGTMTIWDRGTFEVLKWEPRKIEVRLHGERLDARYALFPIDKEDPPKDWMIHRMDPPADGAGEPMPARIVPMLARSAERPPEGDGWGFEIKWDGVRAIAYCSPGEVRLESRNLNDISDSYPEIAQIDRSLGSHRAVLDGELVAFDAAGRPSFGALQQRMHVASREQARRLAKGTPVTYVIFDLLWLDGHSLMEEPYSARREQLAALALEGPGWQTPDHVVGHGSELLQASVEQRLEGIVAKRLDSAYRPGHRGGSWLKIKTMGRQEFVIGGWLAGKGRRRETIGALLLGVHEGGALRFVGRVGTGFTDAELDRLQGLLGPLERPDSPFTSGPRPPREAVFCEPKLVAEVEFAEWTSAGNIRHPSYKGLREDKSAVEVVREDATAPPEAEDSSVPGPGRLEIEDRGSRGSFTSVGGHELKLSNLREGPLSRDGFHQGSADRLLRSRLRRPFAPPRRPAAHRDPLARRGRGQVLLSEAGAGAPAAMGAHGHRGEFRQADRLHAGRRPPDADLAGQPGGDRAAHPARAGGGDGVPDGGRLRPRPRGGSERDRVLPGGAAPAGDVRAPRPRVPGQDLGLEGTAAVSPAELPVGHL